MSQDNPGRPPGCRGSRVLADIETSSSRDREPWRSVGQTPLADIVLRDGLARTPSPDTILTDTTHLQNIRRNGSELNFFVLSNNFFFFSFFFFFLNFLRAHCARDSAHVVANPIQPNISNTSSINQTGNLAVYLL